MGENMTKTFQNKQINAYLSSNRALKEHEKKMLEIISERMPIEKENAILDIGCADGFFLAQLKKQYPHCLLDGIEINQELVEKGLTLHGETINLINTDISSFAPNKKYDLIHASGILSVFDDPLLILEKWLSWLKPNGRLMLFGCFSYKDIDMRIYYRNHHNNHGWESGFTNYSINYLSEFFNQKFPNCFTFDFIPFSISEPLPEHDDPIRSYTMKMENGNNLIVVGGLIICNMYHVVIVKK